MLKRYKWTILLFVTVLLINVFSSSTSLGKDNLDEHSLPYQIFCINEYNTGIFLVTANVNIETGLVEVKYLPNPGDKIKSVFLNISEASANFNELKLIQSFEFEVEKLAPKERNKIKKFNVSNLKKGIKLVLWVGNVTPTSSKFVPLEKKDVLERVKGILWEQYRLVEIASNKGNEDLLFEISRNYEE